MGSDEKLAYSEWDDLEPVFEKVGFCDYCGRKRRVRNWAYNLQDNRSQHQVPDAGYEWICEQCYREIDEEMQERLTEPTKSIVELTPPLCWVCSKGQEGIPRSENAVLVIDDERNELIHYGCYKQIYSSRFKENRP